MINTSRLEAILIKYKQDFTDMVWPDEKYKWEAVQCFQENWNVTAEDFHMMLTNSLAKTNNLLTSANFFPSRMIKKFAKEAPEEVRAMFIGLFDEAQDVVNRINSFKIQSEKLLEEYGAKGRSHYQTENAITTYLWLKYPNKYYIYKYGEVKSVAQELASDLIIKKGAYADNIRNSILLYNEICTELKKDTELINLLKTQLTPSCYPDPELRTLAIDVGFYISRHLSKNDSGITEEFDFIMDSIREENPIAEKMQNDPYTKNDFLDEVYMTENTYDMLVSVLQNKKNIILQGPPGVGKTFAAKRLAYSIMKEKDENRIEFVQFHQNYSYEDFVMGYKPVDEGFDLKYGIFYRFCKKAENQPDKDFYFIIDEINRGNLSKIFGELLMLIERDYRETKVTLAYNGLSFSVPKNLYIIGMMNTADRSLAMIDYALRRRFSFFELEPGLDSDGYLTYQQSLDNETFNELMLRVKELNKEITLDKSLGKGFCIGHSYFCGQKKCTEEWLQSVVRFEMLPMLREYWFDDAGKLQRWENLLLGMFQ